MAEKIVYSALPKGDMDNMFDMLESTADLLAKMAMDTNLSWGDRTNSSECAAAIREKVQHLRTKVEIL